MQVFSIPEIRNILSCAAFNQGILYNTYQIAIVDKESFQQIKRGRSNFQITYCLIY